MALKREILTDKQYWESRWDRVKLPVEFGRSRRKYVDSEIINIFHRFFPRRNNLRVIEIGGAPGGILAYLVKEFNYDGHALEYTDIGCEKLQANFDLLHLRVTIHKRDLFGNLSDLPRFDIVYSFGFIEHFSDVNTVVGRHLELLQPGGVLLLVVPNFLGLAEVVMKRMAPECLSRHNLDAMKRENWQLFADHFHLQTLFLDYLGGFDGRNFIRCERRTIVNRMIRLYFKGTSLLTSRIRFFGRLNSRYWSGCLLGVFTKQ